MKIKQNKIIVAFIFSAVFLVGASAALAQTDSTQKKRLKNPATVKGFVGGEAHDGYVIHAREGQTMSVRITWRKKKDNRAEFSVSKSATFFDGEQIDFGKVSSSGKNWSGKIPETGDYYIYVVAHPTANYTLKVSFK